MSDFYSDMQAIVSGILDEFTQGTIWYVTKTRVAGATPDAPGASGESATPIKAVSRPVSTKFVDGTHIIQTDEEIVMKADGVVPTMDGWITVDGVRLKIVKIIRTPPAGTAIVYVLVVRR